MESKLRSAFHHVGLRQLQEKNCDIQPHNLMYPVFVIADDDGLYPIETMPGVARMGLKKLRDHVKDLLEVGLNSILLFGVVDSNIKDETASAADTKDNPVIRALQFLKKTFPSLVLAADVCLCAYTNHGHCGILKDKVIDNKATIERLADVALAYARAGADIVAPSDMMDNRVASIKKALLGENMENVSILSYSCKFASGFYGPFRDAADSSPSFGDRKSHQLPIGARGLAIRAAARDVQEGADMLMVKPGLPYLDIVRDVANNHPNHLIYVYQVSGEYSMFYYAAQNGTLNLKDAVMESMKSFRRAGADCVVTYFTPLILEHLNSLKNE